ncbi:helix-turn-helix domain-containing protein [Streptomyces sp. HPF1205]|uniref:helix-turn-helix domain-containing protein n=1 Tax=Streptomyces sp. HPF1205 TaxID=2873262 RepID=UPI001CED0ABE|nr:helix-turn-helix domain-containing protein [Streptomyces sp. HPF1205]
MMSPDGIGHLLRALRDGTGRTRHEQARHLEQVSGRFVDPENLKRWETEKRLPVPFWHEVIARGYGLTVDEVRRAVAASRRHRTLVSTSVPLDDPEEVSPVERRGFLGASIVAAGMAAEPWGRLAAAVAGLHVDSALADQLVDATAELFVSEHHVPARVLAQRLGTHLETLTALLPRSGPHRRALTVAAGETAALAGWAAYDVGDLETARNYYKTAVLAGREAGRPPVVALSLGYASYALPSNSARDMLASAQQHVRGPGYATARSWLAAREAEESAAVDDREGAVRALDRATTAFDYANPNVEQAWMRFYQRPRLDSLMVSTYARLRHRDLAATAQAALDHLGDDDSKVRIAVLADVATGYLVSGDVDQAVDVGRRFVQAATATPTTMGHERLAALAGMLPAQHSAARDLAASVQAALTA